MKDTRRNLAVPFAPCTIVVINKKHRVNAKYAWKTIDPPGIPGTHRFTPPTAGALQAMIAGARRAGHRIFVTSGYRSYALQATYKPSATVMPAGASEHQSGQAVDLAARTARGGQLRGYAFGRSAAGRWVRTNAWRYGFILRYPSGKQSVTGIAYEPWHFRYVGGKHAAAINSYPNLTLEEYFGV